MKFIMKFGSLDVSGEREDRLLHDSDFTGRLDNDGLTMLGYLHQNCGPTICLKCDQINRKSAHGIFALTTKNKVLRCLATKL